MKLHQGTKIVSLAAGIVALAVSAVVRPAVAAERGTEHPWYLSGSIGQLQYEGDDPVKDGLALTFYGGYDFTERWSLEGYLGVAPKLDGQVRHSYGETINILQERAGVTDTSAAFTGIDGLLHVTRWERFDPFLALGFGVTWYEDDFGNQFDPSIRVGGGLMYHFNDEWALRTDGRFYFAGQDTSANGHISVGVVWTIGAGVPARLVASGGPLDSDGDGLTDSDEAKYGTDPFDPDSDHDGLMDGEEVHTYHTDPLNADTDYDGLKDGAEVKQYKTNPTLRDTDNGGVADGHEVIEDHTDPLNPADDLQLFELNINFDTDKAIIKAEYFKDLDVIGKVLTRDGGAKARIEGHADKRKGSKEGYNQKLSERRAQSILNYLAEKWGVSPDRMTPVGYGFSRPKAQNDEKNGNILNRRTEIYIRHSEGADKSIPPAE